MADIKIACTRVACPTATGTQDITIAGFGTPKVALFIVTVATADGTATNHCHIGFGATDGTRQWSVGNNSRHSSATTSDSRRGMTDKCIHLLIVTGNIEGEAHFDSWITDGVRINWTDAMSGAYLMTVVFFGGADLTARVDTLDLGTVTTAQTYSSLSAEADLIIGYTSGQIFNDTTANNYTPALGLCHNNKSGTITQRCIAFNELTGQADGAPVALMDNDKFYIKVDAAAPSTPQYTVSLSNFTSSGFDFTCTANTGNTNLGIIALSLGGAASSVGTYNPPTSATSSTISASFTPQFCLLGLCGVVTADVGESDGDAGVFGISTLDATNQFCNSNAIEDLSPTTDTQSMSDNQAITLPAHDGASNLHQATLTSFNSSGTNLNFTTASATTRQWIYMMIEAGTTPAGGGAVIYNWGIFDSFIQGKPRSFIKGMKCPNI